MDTKLALIRAGKLTGLAEQFKDCSASDCLQVLRYASRHAFDSSSVCPDLLSIITQVCTSLLATDDLNLATYIKSLYYVVQVSTKKDDYASLLQLLPCIAPVLVKCHNNADTSTFLKSLYQITWNSSLRSEEPRVSLKVQCYALTFLLMAAPDMICKVASLADMAVVNFRSKSIENNKQSNALAACLEQGAESKQLKDINNSCVTFYHRILSAVLSYVACSKKIDSSEVISIIDLLNSCSIHQNPTILKSTLKLFKSYCEQRCYTAVYTGMQILHGALRVRHCNKEVSELDTAMKTLVQYTATITSTTAARDIALHCLLAALTVLEDNTQPETTYCLPLDTLEPILRGLLTLSTADAALPAKVKVASSLCQFMRTVVTLLRSCVAEGQPGAAPTQGEQPPGGTEAEALCGRAASWSRDTEGCLRLLLSPAEAVTGRHYHNLGVCCGNLGVLCYRASQFPSAAACLTDCIALQDSYVVTATAERVLLSSSVHKKRALLCDALRYTELYHAAATVLARQVLQYAVEASEGAPTPAGANTTECSANCDLAQTSVAIEWQTAVPLESLIAQWIKLKRDALKTQSSELEGVLLWTLVAELHQSSSQPSLCLTELKTQLLLQEYAAYTAASWDCSRDQLLCSERLYSHACSALLHTDRDAGLKLVVQSLVMAAQVLYIHPDRAVPAVFSRTLLQQQLRTLQGEPLSAVATTCCATSSADSCPALCLLSDALAVCSTVTAVASSSDGTGHSSTARECSNNTSLPPHWRELAAELHYWLHLALLQQQQLGRTQETPCPAAPLPSLTAAATDLGEEQQPDDACDVRHDTVALLYSDHHAVGHLDTALWYWQHCKTVPLLCPTSVCRLLCAAGHTFRQHGHTLSTVRCWALLVHQARRCELHSYLLTGCVELVWTSPELCGAGIIACIEEQLATGRHDTHSTVLARVALALYCLTHGKISEGWCTLQSVLTHEVVLEKKTVRATEVQCLAHYLASLYSMLPTIQADQPVAYNPVAVAQLAAREAIALTHSTPEQPGLHWSERVTWLHQLTSVWLARLSLLTAQPRLARAYLKQPLMLAHELALPYRAADVLSLLAEVDLMCDQTEDCRVKLDTLLALFAPERLQVPAAARRASHQPLHDKKTPVKQTNANTVASRQQKLVQRSVGKENKLLPSTVVPSIRIEAIRHDRTSNSVLDDYGETDDIEDSFVVRDGQVNLGSHHLIGIEARFKHLSLKSTKLDRNKLEKDQTLCPASPSFEHREAATLMPKWPSGQQQSSTTGNNNNNNNNSSSREPQSPQLFTCDDTHEGPTTTATLPSPAGVLSAYFPGFCHVYLSCAVMLADLHRHSQRWHSAAACTHMAAAAYSDMQEQVRDLCATVCSIVSEHCPSAAAEAGQADLASLLMANTFTGPWCQLQLCTIQLLCARSKWREAGSVAHAALTAAASLPSQSLLRHHSVLLPLMLQSTHLQTAMRLQLRDPGTRQFLSPKPVDPVALPSSHPTTPTRSPTREPKRPPPLRRTPLLQAHKSPLLTRPALHPTTLFSPSSSIEDASTPANKDGEAASFTASNSFCSDKSVSVFTPDSTADLSAGAKASPAELDAVQQTLAQLELKEGDNIEKKHSSSGSAPQSSSAKNIFKSHRESKDGAGAGATASRAKTATSRVKAASSKALSSRSRGSVTKDNAHITTPPSSPTNVPDTNRRPAAKDKECHSTASTAPVRPTTVTTTTRTRLARPTTIPTTRTRVSKAPVEPEPCQTATIKASRTRKVRRKVEDSL